MSISGNRTDSGMDSKSASVLGTPSVCSIESRSASVRGTKAIEESALLDKLSVGLRVHELVELGEVVGADPHHPAPVVRGIVDQLRMLAQLLVDCQNFASQR